jgi:TonB family protein
MVIAVVLLLGLITFAGLRLNQARTDAAGDRDRLEMELSTAKVHIGELEASLAAEHSARVGAETAAQEAGATAAQAQAEAQKQAETFQVQIDTLSTRVNEQEQRATAAEEAKAKAETALSRESGLREKLEQEIGDVRKELEQQAAMLSQFENNTTDPPVAPAAPGSRASGTSAAKLKFDDEEREAATTLGFDTPPKGKELQSPEYPSGEKDGGYVLVSFTVDVDGRVKEIQVREATNSAFEAAVVAAVRKWRFDPAELEGKPVAVRIAQRLDFPAR